MALHIEKAFGVKMDTLMGMQASYDIAQTRKREKQIHVRRIRLLVGLHSGAGTDCARSEPGRVGQAQLLFTPVVLNSRGSSLRLWSPQVLL